MNNVYISNTHIRDGLPIDLFIQFTQTLATSEGDDACVDFSQALVIIDDVHSVEVNGNARILPMDGKSGILFERNTLLKVQHGSGLTHHLYHHPFTGKIIYSEQPITPVNIGTNPVNQWLATGDTGTSSRTLCKHLFQRPEVISDHAESYPRDPADFLRCRLFIRDTQCDTLQNMKTVSPEWAALVQHWNELCDLMDSEVQWFQGNPQGKAPQTYTKMESILEQARDLKTSKVSLK